jgi:acetyltransferase-like isoleucine patch superfamily enzyme
MIVKALRSIQRDLTLAGWMIFRTSIAGSVLVPQIVRTMLYRLSGLDIRSFNVREGQVFENDHVHIGDQTYVSRNCSFEGNGAIVIGSQCQVSAETMFITSNHKRLADGSIDHNTTALGITVGDGVWIGARSVILPGTIIEDNCIIAAGSVVRGRCLADSTYGGVPVRLLSSPLRLVDSSNG